MRAVSTALSYIILLSLTLVLLAFTLSSYVDFQLQIKGPMEQSLNASKAMSEDYASLMGFADPEIEVERTYSGPEDAELSIETYPPYILGEDSLIVLRITNPTSRVMRIGRVDANSELFNKTFNDLSIIYTHEEEVTFAPESPGTFPIHAEIQNGTDAEASIEVSSEGSGEGPENSGLHTFETFEINTDDLDTLTVAMNCTFETESATSDYWSGAARAGVSLNTPRRRISFGYASGSWPGYATSVSGCESCSYVHNQNDLAGCYSNGAGGYHPCRSTRGMLWTNATVGAGASATGGCYAGEICSVSIGTAAIEITPDINEVSYVVENLIDSCAGGDWESLPRNLNASCTCANDLTTTLHYWVPESDTLFRINNGSPRKDNTRITFLNSTTITYTKTYSGTFRVPDQYIENAILYVFAYQDMRIRLRVNNYWIYPDWTDLKTHEPQTIDLTHKIAPKNVDNAIEVWMEPSKTGEFTIDWSVQVR